MILLESLLPVVTCIRGMEEEDGVPLSYPYPAPATASTPTSAPTPTLTLGSGSSPLSSPSLLGQGTGRGQGVRQGQGNGQGGRPGQGQGQGGRQGVRQGQQGQGQQGQGQEDYRDSYDHSPKTTGVKMVRKFGRVSEPLVPEIERTDVLTQIGRKRSRPGGNTLPTVCMYGASSVHVQSEGTAAACKWRAAVLASSAISSKVRDL